MRPRREATMRRREFIGLAGGAMALPFSARARANREYATHWRAAWYSRRRSARPRYYHCAGSGFQTFSWVDRRNAKIHYRGASNPADLQRYAKELLTLSPDVMVATGGTSVGPLLQAAPKTVPIVFAECTGSRWLCDSSKACHGDCQGTRPDSAANTTRACRRSDRITPKFAAVRMSPIGTIS